MENILERLTELIEEFAGGKYTVFAKKAGIQAPAMHNYMKGRMLSGDSLINICETFNVNITWLLTGRGGKYVENEQSSEGAKNIDSELLKTVVMAVEDGLNDRDLVIASDKKAELIALLYDQYSKSEEKIDGETVKRYLRLVA